MGRRNADGTVTKPTGAATIPRGGGSGRGFVPQGAKPTGRSGSQVKRAAGPLRVGPRTASNKVEGK